MKDIFSKSTAEDKIIYNNARLEIKELGESIAEAGYTDKNGAYEGCLVSLESLAKSRTITSWFSEGDLSKLKQHAYTAGWLWHISMLESNTPFSTSAYAINCMEVMVSDHEPLIRWYADNEPSVSPKQVENPKTWEYWAHLFRLSLIGDWEPLRQRAQYVVDHPDQANKKYLLADYRFYAALANRDVATMEEALFDIANTKARWLKFEGGLTEGLISTPGTIYAKIAWRHGFEVNPGTPFIQQAWLPVAPLPHYEDRYDFMKDFPV